MKTFKHNGLSGDIIYSLPTIKALGGGILYLNPEQTVGHITDESAQMITPLILAQPYIADVKIYNGEKIDYDLGLFRHCSFDLANINLVEAHLKTFGLPIELKNEQWLFNVGTKKVYEKNIVFHRSHRHHGDNFPWELLEIEFGWQGVFIGLESEHKEFTDEFDCSYIPHYQVEDFLEMAEIINGADYFFGNQSLPFAISEGLHGLNFLEICPPCPNCIFYRNGHNINPIK